jgi:hypothetical protein
MIIDPFRGQAMATANRVPNPDEKLVRIFDSDEESEVMVVRGLLESAGIDCDVSNLEAPQDVLPGVGGMVILVREGDADEALAVIQAGRNAAGASVTEELSPGQQPTSRSDKN